MKTFIVFTLLMVALPAYAVSNDRASFMCTVGTLTDECPKYAPMEYIEPKIAEPLQATRAPEPMISATSTSIDTERITQLKALIEQLRALIEQLRVQQANEVS